MAVQHLFALLARGTRHDQRGSDLPSALASPLAAPTTRTMTRTMTQMVIWSVKPRGGPAGMRRHNEQMATSPANLPTLAAGAASVYASSNVTPDGAADPRAGLTETDIGRITMAIAANHAESTLAVYACAWRRWEARCLGRGLDPLPGAPAVVSACLTERAAQGVCFGTIEVACSAIANEHRSRGVVDPIAHETVRQVRRGLRRALGTAPRRQAHPLSWPRSAGSSPPSTGHPAGA